MKLRVGAEAIGLVWFGLGGGGGICVSIFSASNCSRTEGRRRSLSSPLATATKKKKSFSLSLLSPIQLVTVRDACGRHNAINEIIVNCPLLHSRLDKFLDTPDDSDGVEDEAYCFDREPVQRT